MKFADVHRDFLIKSYVEDNRSTYEIAEELETYPNKIRRALKHLGIGLRDKSKAQSAALASGRHKHPTKGTNRPERVKIQIIEQMFNYWDTMYDKERDRRSNLSKQQWEAMSEEDKDKMRRLAGEAMRLAGKEGSKMEKFLYEELTRRGYSVIFHKKGLISNEKMEIDLFLPELNTAIEIDGPAHFFPIWGEEKLRKHISADARKSGLLLNAGFVVLRVKHLTKSLSNKHKRDLLARVLESLEVIENKFPNKSKRFIELEV